jgi:methylase of polypeptide subunit release factors
MQRSASFEFERSFCRRAFETARFLYVQLTRGRGAQSVTADFARWRKQVHPFCHEPLRRPRVRKALTAAVGEPGASVERFGVDGGERKNKGRGEGRRGPAETDAEAALYSLHATAAALAAACLDPQGKAAADLAEDLFFAEAVALLQQRLDPKWVAEGRARICAREADTLGHLFHGLVEHRIRHAFGEYHTGLPLVRLVLDEVAGELRGGGRLLDPGCGSGVFLVSALDRLRADGVGDEQALNRIQGYDTSPLAVFLARMNLYGRLRGVRGRGDGSWLRVVLDRLHRVVQLNDSILGDPQCGGEVQRFEVVVGNPPWVRWELISTDYRKKVLQLVEKRPALFEEKGLMARLGAASDDLLGVFTALSADRYLQDGGVLVFVIKHTVLTNRTGRAFRTLFHTGLRGMQLGLDRVHDLRGCHGLFDGGEQESAVVVARLGRPVRFPIPCQRWRMDGVALVKDVSISLVEIEPSTPGSALMERPSADKRGLHERWRGLSAYADSIRHGLKHDAEKVFGLKLQGRGSGKGIDRGNEQGNEKRKRERKGKGQGKATGTGTAPATVSVTAKGGGRTWELESALVYPYVKPRHIGKWWLRGWEHVLVPQRRAGQDNQEMLKERFPATFSYLDAHREKLAQRKSSVFASGPFYGVFGLGPYTFASFRVVWCGLGLRPYFAVVAPVCDPLLGTKPPVVDGSCYAVATATLEEAYYLAGVLNSTPACEFLKAHACGSKRALSKTALTRMAVPAFDGRDARMKTVAALARQLAENSRKTLRADGRRDRRVANGGAHASPLAAKAHDIPPYEARKTQELERRLNAAVETLFPYDGSCLAPTAT